MDTCTSSGSPRSKTGSFLSVMSLAYRWGFLAQQVFSSRELLRPVQTGGPSQTGLGQRVLSGELSPEGLPKPRCLLRPAGRFRQNGLPALSPASHLTKPISQTSAPGNQVSLPSPVQQSVNDGPTAARRRPNDGQQPVIDGPATGH